ncbi:hypothetical protein [Hymenobacter sp. UV11]|nr:hypothetical protein [Hymenobacter sp. UV11]
MPALVEAKKDVESGDDEPRPPPTRHISACIAQQHTPDGPGA